jgi:glucuronate isomerase
MLFLAKMYHSHDLVMQLHFGAIRNINESMYGRLGPDTGFDTMGETVSIRGIAPLFNRLSSAGQLPKTILFPSSSLDHEKLNAFSNCFTEEKVRGKVQTGAPWWFLDHKDGIETCLKSFGRQGLLSVFIGMLTDSRSILSMTRHEYFRRILCNLLGKWIENGELHNEEAVLEEIIRNLCYDNAVNYFHFNDRERIRQNG